MRRIPGKHNCVGRENFDIDSNSSRCSAVVLLLNMWTSIPAWRHSFTYAAETALRESYPCLARQWRYSQVSEKKRGSSQIRRCLCPRLRVFPFVVVSASTCCRCLSVPAWVYVGVGAVVYRSGCIEAREGPQFSHSTQTVLRVFG